MNKIDILKGATEIVVSMSVASIVGNVIKLSKEPNMKLYKRIGIGIGGAVLSSMVADMAVKFSENKIDEYVDIYNKVFTVVKLTDGSETIFAEAQDIPEEELSPGGYLVDGVLTFVSLEAAKYVVEATDELITVIGGPISLNSIYTIADINDPLKAEDDEPKWGTINGFKIAETPAGFSLIFPDIVKD